MSVTQWKKRLYPRAEHRDPLPVFLQMLERHLRPTDQVLELGAGAGLNNHYALKGKVRRIVGVDVDPRVRENPLLDEGVEGDVCRLPFADCSFDVAFCIYVLEHIAEPSRFVAEVRRVLKPGGLFLALTPNRHHYVSLAARCTPTWFHKWYNARRGRHEADTFPTFYRMNSRKELRKQFTAAGFAFRQCSMIETQPNYLTFCTPAFLMGAAYERLVNSLRLLAGFRVNIACAFAVGKKAE